MKARWGRAAPGYQPWCFHRWHACLWLARRNSQTSNKSVQEPQLRNHRPVYQDGEKAPEIRRHVRVIEQKKVSRNEKQLLVPVGPPNGQ